MAFHFTAYPICKSKDGNGYENSWTNRACICSTFTLAIINGQCCEKCNMFRWSSPLLMVIYHGSVSISIDPNSQQSSQLPFCCHLFKIVLTDIVFLTKPISPLSFHNATATACWYIQGSIDDHQPKKWHYWFTSDNSTTPVEAACSIFFSPSMSISS